MAISLLQDDFECPYTFTKNYTQYCCDNCYQVFKEMDFSKDPNVCAKHKNLNTSFFEHKNNVHATTETTNVQTSISRRRQWRSRFICFYFTRHWKAIELVLCPINGKTAPLGVRNGAFLCRNETAIAPWQVRSAFLAFCRHRLSLQKEDDGHHDLIRRQISFKYITDCLFVQSETSFVC